MGERQLDDSPTCGIARNTGATHGKAATVSVSPRGESAASSGSPITASPIHCGATTSEASSRRQAGAGHPTALNAPEWTFSPAFRRYSVPQYGHLAAPVEATSRKTRGWLLHSGIFGLGQKRRHGLAGRREHSTTALFLDLWSHRIHTLVSHSAYLGLRPLTMSKNALWIFSVIGPR